MPKRVPKPSVPAPIPRPKKKVRKAKKTRCQICKEVMERLTASHLRMHGWTMHRYARVYGERPSFSSAQTLTTQSVTDPNAQLIEAVADRLTSHKAWVACIADEVGEAILSGPLRQRLSTLLTTMLYQRAKVHGQALGVLSGALEELQQEWRIVQGGDEGGPTDTDTLLRMVEKAGKLVHDSEQAVQRTIKLALDEQRLAADTADALGPALYQGTGERLDMPAGLTTGDRETIRNLFSLVGKAANESGTIDVTPVDVSNDETAIDRPTNDASSPGTAIDKALSSSNSINKSTNDEQIIAESSTTSAPGIGSLTDPPPPPAPQGGPPPPGSLTDPTPSTTHEEKSGGAGTPRSTRNPGGDSLESKRGSSQRRARVRARKKAQPEGQPPGQSSSA
jgi:hypothetical protein